MSCLLPLNSPWMPKTGECSYKALFASPQNGVEKRRKEKKMVWGGLCCVEDDGKRGEKSACHVCGRRHMLSALLALNSYGRSNAAVRHSDPLKVLEAVHPARPGWYEELYAFTMNSGMKSYEMEISGYKKELFNHLDEKAKTILELGVGTGPNIKYYAKLPGIKIFGIDPNRQMEKYARAEVHASGLADSQFEFLQGVGEALPVQDSSMDAVISTLVLCSVNDVKATLEEVQRVLKPGGLFLFVEHVAGQERSGTRFWQNLLDPVQQFVADGCHLTRNTAKEIEDAKFSRTNIGNVTISSVSLISPHIVGIAQA